MSNVQNDAGMLLGHPQQTEVVGGISGGKKSNEGVILEKNDRAPSLEKFKQLHGGNATLD